MNNKYIIGGIVVLGAIALFALYNKPKKNKEGFYGASGRGSSIRRVSSQNCAWCKTNDGTIYHTGGDRNCSAGDRCITRYAFSKGIN